MHIKQVIIQGFKSYKEQLHIEEFSSKHNAVVGRNGAGKSNFFRAIQFVLGEKGFTNLTHKERQELLHEGAGANVMTAFVEIVFDNTDGRFAVDAEEVVLRRTIGLKKDEYFLNRKHVSKGDVVNLLESAGFSRSNPYYIVQQGKVNMLCMMKDSQRLDLLKEVAGTTVYEERRKASKQILATTANKREKNRQVIAYIEERLEELKEEKKELQEFRSLDRQRRALEYTLYDQELHKATQQLEQLEIDREEEVQSSHDTSNQLLDLTDQIELQAKAHQDLVDTLAGCENERDAIEQEKGPAIKERANAELLVRDLEERMQTHGEQRELNRKELAELEKTITDVQADLVEKTSAHEQKRDAHAGIVDTLSTTQQRVDELYDKQGRVNQFASGEERDKWLTSEIESMQKVVQSRRDLRKDLAESMDKLNLQSDKLASEASEISADLQKYKKELDDKEQQLGDLQKSRDDHASQRKEHWRTAQQLDTRAKKIREDLENAKKLLKRSMPLNISLGLEAVETIAEELKLPGVYGPVYDLITPSDQKFNAAIETAAGNALMHVIVDTDETAAKLMKELHRRKAGRVTFKPLNQIRTRNQEIANFPTDQTDAIPLITKISFKPIFRNAVESIFGKVLLCRDTAIAGEFSRTFKVNCVTMDGDEVNRRGAMTGGYVDSRRSKLGAIAKLKECRAALKNNIKEGEDTKATGQKLDQQVTKAMSDMDTIQMKCGHLRKSYKILFGESKQVDKKQTQVRDQIAALKPKLEQSDKALEEVEAKIKSMEQEIATPMQDSLEPDEIQELKDKEAQILTLKERQVDARAEMEQARSLVSDLERELQENLLKRKDDLLIQLDEAISNADEEDGTLELQLSQAKAKLEDLSGNLDQSLERHRELETEIARQKKKREVLKEELDDMKQREHEITQTLEKGEERVERLLTKRGVLIQRREASTQKIRQLGSLPTAELENYANDSTKKLLGQIQTVHEELKKYSHVNKKALDQFVNFSDQREALKKRIEEMDRGDESLKQLIQHLDRQKDESIMRTFRGVAKNFREVFKELVPSGRGELVIITKDSEDEHHDGDGVEKNTDNTTTTRSNNENGDEEEEQVEHFVGVCPKVSFTGKGEVFSMRQLSGGQKALVALALIFAIQRCDPAPFYLFDEIDQALDSNHRASVAALINRQANAAKQPAQFITTTFRAELVEVADKVYGVTMSNKISSVERLGHDEGLAFIQRIIAEEEAVQHQRRQSTGQRRRSNAPASKKNLKFTEEEDEAPQSDQENAPERAQDGRRRSARKRSRGGVSAH